MVEDVHVLYKQFQIMDFLDTNLKWELDDLTLSQVSTTFLIFVRLF